MNPLRQSAGILPIVLGAGSGLGYSVFSLVSAFSTPERFDAPGGRDATLEPGDYTAYRETPGVFVAGNVRGPDVRVTVSAQDRRGNPTVTPSGLRVSRDSTGSRIGVSVTAFRIERKGIYEISASASPGKTLPAGGIAITRGPGFFGVFRLVLTTLAPVGGGVGGGLVILLKKPASAA
jgi:hypothetical protein